MRQGKLEEQCNNYYSVVDTSLPFPFWRNAKKLAGIEFAGGQIS